MPARSGKPRRALRASPRFIGWGSLARPNAEFTAVLGGVLSRPTLFPMPAFAARLAFGEMADALLLASLWVLPRTLSSAGFEFKHPDLEAALRDLLGRPEPSGARTTQVA